MVLPILQGPLKGKKWIKGSGVNSYWLGTFELYNQQAFIDNIKKNDVVFDLGGQAGFYTLLASDLVGPSGKVVVFEPLPFNIYNINKHLKMNHCKNVEVVEAAVMDYEGEAGFYQKGANTSDGQICEDGEIKVKTMTIDGWIKAGKLPIPNFMKIDVEGTEAEVLEGAKETLTKYHPILVLSGTYDKIKWLSSLGYDLKPTYGTGMPAGDFLCVYKNNRT